MKGSIRLESSYLNIGPDATVQSNVVAREVVVRGSVIGNVNVSERIDIRNGGSLVGDVTAHSVSIEEGAYFKGSIDMRRSGSARQVPTCHVRAPSVEVVLPPPRRSNRNSRKRLRVAAGTEACTGVGQSGARAAAPGDGARRPDATGPRRVTPVCDRDHTAINHASRAFRRDFRVLEFSFIARSL